MADIRNNLAQPILVTGGAGFIGRHLVEQLLQLDNDVAVFDVPAARLPDHWSSRIRFMPGDIAQAADVAAAMTGVGTVFHAAAVVTDWAPAADYERTTLGGSRLVFDAAVRNGSRVILLSSFAVYGDLVGRTELTEDLPFGRPLGIYGRYKQQQEELAWRYHREQHMPLTVVRPAKVFGPGSPQWLHEVARNLLAARPVLINGGNFNPALVCVDNLIDLLILAASLPQALGRTYNGWDGIDVTWRRYCTDLAQIIDAPSPRTMPGWVAQTIGAVAPPLWRLLGKKTRPLMTPDSLRNLMTDYRISMARVCGELGFVQRVTYEAAMQRIATYWQTRSRGS